MSEIEDCHDFKLIKTYENEEYALPPREALIATAINFLQNERIRKSPINQKQRFLMSKGLTDQEISLAFSRAGVFTTELSNVKVGGIDPSSSMNFNFNENKTILRRFNDVLQSMVFASAMAFASYHFYKKYIEPFIFGRKKKTVEEHLLALEQKLDKNISDLNKEIISVKNSVLSNNHTEDISLKLHSFKCDLDAIKGLLLNRKQFSSPIPATTVVPSIPAWQLDSARLAEKEVDKNDDTSSDRNDDGGSGSSGSSETEVVTKNSDSSLEIM